jgi:signal transduction histidine kinase
MAEKMSHWGERIIVATSSMKTIMQELVDVARLEMGQALQLDLQPMDLVAMARRLVNEHQVAGRLISMDACAPELVGWWDEARLARMLTNLLDNALKYSPSGARVEVSVARVEGGGGDFAELSVRDRGRGIPPEDLPRVFERFYRGSNLAAETSGSGLGLAVAHQIVEQHGGAIEIESEPGMGTLVRVRIPRGQHAT